MLGPCKDCGRTRIHNRAWARLTPDERREHTAKGYARSGGYDICHVCSKRRQRAKRRGDDPDNLRCFMCGETVARLVLGLCVDCTAVKNMPAPRPDELELRGGRWVRNRYGIAYYVMRESA